MAQERMFERAPRPMIPALRGSYAAAAPFAEPMVRIIAGLWLVPHGAQKLFGWFGGGGLEGTAGFLSQAGFEPAMFWTVAIALTEFVGGLMLALGLLTRLAALAITIFLATAVVHHWPNGFFWPDGGWEYPALWAVVAFSFVLRGGGRHSLDHAIGREI